MFFPYIYYLVNVSSPLQALGADDRHKENRTRFAFLKKADSKLLFEFLFDAMLLPEDTHEPRRSHHYSFSVPRIFYLH